MKALLSEEDLLEVALCAFRTCDDEEELADYVEAVFQDFNPE